MKSPQSLFRFASLVVASLLLWPFVAASQGQAAPILTESFASPVDSLPEFWARQKRHTSAPNTVAMISTEASGPWLKLQRPDGGNSNAQGAVFYTGSAGSIENGMLDDFSGQISVAIRDKNSSSIRGIVVRAQQQSYEAFNGYYLAFDKGGLGIWYNPVDHVNHGQQLVYTPFTESLVNGEEYRLAFSVVGSQLALEMTTLDQSIILAAAAIDLNDFNDIPLHEGGYFGLRGGFGGADYVLFRDLEIRAIPEPQSAYLLLGALGLGGILLVRGKR